MLRSYSGDRGREHVSGAGAPRATAVYGRDQTRTKVYGFSSLGFRSEEYDPDASVTIFVCGCSNAFGTGLNVEETWAHRFKLAYAAKHGYAPQDVNVLNFSQGGASNDYISRTLLSQCAEVTPHLILAQFTTRIRTEGFANAQPFSIGAGMWPSWSLCRRFLGVAQEHKRAVFSRLRCAAGYSQYYSAELGFLNALRNILLVQCYCQANGIACVMSWRDHRHLADPEFADNPALAPFVKLIDRTMLADFAIGDPDICVDRAADHRHPGPLANAAFAARLLDFHERTARPLPAP